MNLHMPVRIIQCMLEASGLIVSRLLQGSSFAVPCLSIICLQAEPLAQEWEDVQDDDNHLRTAPLMHTVFSQEEVLPENVSERSEEDDGVAESDAESDEENALPARRNGPSKEKFLVCPNIECSLRPPSHLRASATTIGNVEASFSLYDFCRQQGWSYLQLMNWLHQRPRPAAQRQLVSTPLSWPVR